MNDKLTINYEGEDRDLLMSYGLLNELVIIVGSPEVTPTIAVNPLMREDVLKACLAERKPSGKISKPIADMDDINISIADVEKILEWASEHVLNFFVRSLGRMLRQVEANKDTFEGLKSSLAGLEASTSAAA